MDTPPTRQLTLRAALAGALLGGCMSLSNLYVALKSGWSIGVSITAGILAFAIFAALQRVRLVRTPFGMLENNAMQSVASSAGYMTGGGTVAAIPALMMLTGQAMDGLQMFVWIAAIALLGVVMAIPMKQQMINVEQLRFPTGIAAAETLQALHGAGEDAAGRARLLGWGGLVGALVALARDLRAPWVPWNLPHHLSAPAGLTLQGRPLAQYTLSLDTSVILLGAGAIMGFRAAWSMLAGAAVNYLVLAPALLAAGVLHPQLGYRNIVAWSVWFGSAVILSGGLLAFALEWRTVLRALRSVGGAFSAATGRSVSQEVPLSWFFAGVGVAGPLVVWLEWWIFGITPWLGAFSVILAFFIAIVACRATGETDTTPTGALGKITQVTFGVLDPGNATTNLMTANVTGGVGLHAADLLTDLKSGYLLKADPRQQFWAQLIGVLAGSLCVVPAYRLLIPSAAELGGERWPAPGAQTWKGVAELLSRGVESLHPSARLAIAVGLALGVILVLLERKFPRARRWIPSPVGLGLGFTTPAYNSLSMFLGALAALLLLRRRPAVAERAVVPVSSGFIAGESLVGVFIAALVVLGLVQG